MKFFAAILCLVSLTARAGDLHISEQRCNYSINPVGIDDFTPSLSWKIKANSRGLNQSAYLVIVTTPTKSGERFEVSEVWNSGKVISDQSTGIRYSGKPLRYGKRYVWKIKVWDSKGIESDFSDIAFWEMSIDPAQWTADWISAPTIFDLNALNHHRYAMIKGEKHDYLEPLPLLKKQFTLKRNVARARIYAAGLGFYELYLNGQKVSSDVLSPPFTNYDKTVLYNVHDVTELLKSGDNAVGVMLGNGWYNSVSKEVWGFDTAPWRNLPTVKLQLEILYDDNSIERIVTDTSWKAIRGPITFSNLRQGEYYDARLEVAQWSEPTNGSQKEWSMVRKVAGPIGTMRPQQLPAVKVMNVLTPIMTKQLSNGNIVYDFGQNIAGFVSITVSGRSGSRLQFKYAERVDNTGAVDQSNINNLLADSLFQVDRYVLKGVGEESWSPRFVYHGFRYAEVSFTGEPVTLIQINANAIHTSFERESEFSCSNELINKIQQATLWSFRNNFVGFPTDCPQREKNGWTGDAQLACETGLTNFNMITSYQKWLSDLREEQQDNGSLPGIVPTSGWGYYWGNGPAWDIACTVIPWTMYQYTGDARLLDENYAMMKKYVDYAASRSPEYIADFGLGDWIPLKTTTPVGMTSTGYFYYAATTVSKAAGILGKEADQKLYWELAEKIKAAFNKKYFNAKELTYANGSQTALSCALFQGLVPENYKAGVSKKLAAAVHLKDDHIDCGILGARYIQHALTANGDASLAYKLVATKTYPGWGYWIENGATTLWEDWKGESSLNHIMLGDVSSWFYKTISGIRPDDSGPGFKRFIIKPEVREDLTWAKGKYESVYGTIVSNWKVENSEYIHDIEVPVNTTAKYYFPAPKISMVKESGKTIRPPDFNVAKNEKNELFILLAPGRYRFTMPAK
jgi:alpha-L-rhamnosidase